MNMKYTIVILCIVLFGFNALSTGPLEMEQKNAIRRLQERKKAYEKYQKRLALREKVRRADSGNQKALRAKDFKIRKICFWFN